MFDVTWLTWWCSLKVGRSPFFIRCINLLNVKRIECVCVLNRGNMCMSHFLLFRFKNGVVELFVLSWLCMDKLTLSSGGGCMPRHALPPLVAVRRRVGAMDRSYGRAPGLINKKNEKKTT